MMHVIADADTYWSILTSPAHILAEVTIEAVSALAIAPIFRWALRRHDRRKHKVAS